MKVLHFSVFYIVLIIYKLFFFADYQKIHFWSVSLYFRVWFLIIPFFVCVQPFQCQFFLLAENGLLAMQLLHHDVIPSLSYGFDNLEKVCLLTKFYHDRSVFLALVFFHKIMNFIFCRKKSANLSLSLSLSLLFLYTHHTQTVSSLEFTKLSLSPSLLLSPSFFLLLRSLIV